MDGFNLYYGIRERGWRDRYWIDPFRLVESLLVPPVDLVSVKYFTARVKRPKEKRERQTRFLDAVRSGNSEIILGKFSERPRSCRQCGAEWLSHEEKMTDSAIAAHLVADAFLDRFDTAILVGGDTDIVPALKIVRTHFPRKALVAWYPPKRQNDAVGNLCDGFDTINYQHLTAALMPDTVTVAPGIAVVRPAEWARDSK
ncbi:MAG: NYN domain-containing protein [Phycisphaerales bacterium JB039]